MIERCLEAFEADAVTIQLRRSEGEEA